MKLDELMSYSTDIAIILVARSKRIKTHSLRRQPGRVDLREWNTLRLTECLRAGRAS